MDDNKKVSRYDLMLEKYLIEGISYDANTISKADKGDLEQLAAGSYWQGWQDANSENGKLPIPNVSDAVCHYWHCLDQYKGKCMNGSYWKTCKNRQTER